MQLDNKLVRSRYGAAGSLYGKSPCKHGAEAACGVAGFSLLTWGDVRCKLAGQGAVIFAIYHAEPIGYRELYN